MKTLLGWYSPNLLLSKGDLVLEYWNGVVNDHSPRGKVADEAGIYTKEHYIACALNLLDKCHARSSKAIIDLPISHVWDADRDKPGYQHDFAPAEWLEDIVKATREHPALAAYYLCDEPEIHGKHNPDGTPISSHPSMPYRFWSDRYFRVKMLCSVPVVAMFSNPHFLRETYLEDLKGQGRFYDIFAWNFYPFPGLQSVWGSVNDARYMLRFAKAIRDEIDEAEPSRAPVLYVGQGCGRFQPAVADEPPKKNWGQDDFSVKDLDRAFAVALDVFGDDLWGYLLWSWSYADETARAFGNIHLKGLDKVKPDRPWPHARLLAHLRRVIR